MSFRYAAGINKPGFNPLAAQTSTTYYNLYGWGFNNYGQLGTGNTTNYSSPVVVGSLTNWLTVSTSYGTSASVKTDGTLWTWGYNVYGQLGLGNQTYYSSPKQVGSLTNWKQVSTSNYGQTQPMTAAVKTDGTLWTWGRNYFGGLGLGNTTSYSSPKQVGALTNWLNVQTGGNWALAIKTNGTLWGWGGNGFGQLGIGNQTNYSSPKQVGALTNWATIAIPTTNPIFVLAVKTDGTLWSWGGNPQGQLGLNNTTYYSSPVQVGALSNWSKIANSGSYYSMAIKTDGTLWGWGLNTSGRLGLGNITTYSSPKQVGALTNWSLIATGRNNSMSIKTDGTLWAWGGNSSGELGLGNTTNYSSPKQVGALNQWLTVSAGNYATLALG